MWEMQYQARYRAQNRARNRAMLELFEGEPTPMRIDLLAAHVEAELTAAEELTTTADHEAVSRARANGYLCGRSCMSPANGPDLANRDEFMAWHAGWHQGYPREVDRDEATRPRGYTPPSGYVCPLCDAPEGRPHTGPKRRYPAEPYSYTNFGVQEMCEDHLIVKRMPERRPGVTFT